MTLTLLRHLPGIGVASTHREAGRGGGSSGGGGCGGNEYDIPRGSSRVPSFQRRRQARRHSSSPSTPTQARSPKPPKGGLYASLTPLLLLLSLLLLLLAVSHCPAGVAAESQTISAGSRHTCAIDAADKVHCWGDDSHGHGGAYYSRS